MRIDHLNNSNQVMQSLQLRKAINFPKLSKEIFKKLNICSIKTSSLSLSELKENHMNELEEATSTMIKIYFNQIENFSYNFYKALNNKDSRFTKHTLSVRIDFIRDAVNTIKPSDDAIYNSLNQTIYDNSMLRIHKEADKLPQIIKNMSGVLTIRNNIKDEIKDILSKLIIITQRAKVNLELS